jgi:hypothetical protein
LFLFDDARLLQCRLLHRELRQVVCSALRYVFWKFMKKSRGWRLDSWSDRVCPALCVNEQPLSLSLFVEPSRPNLLLAGRRRDRSSLRPRKGKGPNSMRPACAMPACISVGALVVCIKRASHLTLTPSLEDRKPSASRPSYPRYDVPDSGHLYVLARAVHLVCVSIPSASDFCRCLLHRGA